MESCGLLLGRLLLLALLTAAPNHGAFPDDCPAHCKCGWTSGKRHAKCTGPAVAGPPPGLSGDVQVLDLSGASIPHLGERAFSRTEQLQELYLRNVGLRQVDKLAFDGLTLLRKVDLTGNQLSRLNVETFSSNEKLRDLLLGGNPLQSLAALQFPALDSLEWLDLSNCQLASVSPRAFKLLTNPTKLNLDGNKLAVLESDVLQSLTRLKTLTLRDNPWRCDCHLRLFRDWLMDRGLYQEGTECVEPERLVGKSWRRSPSEEFACRPQIHIPEKTVVANVGQNVTLRCQISGDPAADTKWVLSGGRILRNNSQVPATEQVYIIHNEGNINRWTNLTVTRVTERDAGQYLCVGSNPAGVVEENVTLVFRSSTAAAPDSAAGPLAKPLVVGVAVGSTSLLLALLLFCCCWCWCRRGARPAAKEATSARDSVMVISQKPPRMGEYEKLPQTDVEMERMRTPAGLGEPSSSVMCNPTGPEPAAARRRSPPDDGGAPDGRRDYPDLLHLPAAGEQRLAAALAPRHRLSLAERPRPSYVTLPRRPRTPSWGSSPALPDPVYDTLGPRTTVDGSSRLSLTGAEPPSAFYLPVEAVPDPAVFRSLQLQRNGRGLAPPRHGRSLSTDLIEPLREVPEEANELPPPPQFTGTPAAAPQARPPPKPKRVPPPVLPPPELNGAFQAESEDGTEV